MDRSARKIAGFTLIELMIVVSIIALLATVGLTVYTQTQRSARDAKRKADIQEIQKALEQYYAVNRTYPASIGSGNINNASYFPDGNVPTDPAGNTYVDSAHYHQATCTGAVKYVICSTTLENNTGNHTGIATDPCSAVGGTTTGNYYCVGSLSN